MLDTGQARNKLLAQWVQLKIHAAGHSRPGTTHLPASQGEGVRAGRLLASSTCSSPGGPTLSSGVLASDCVTAPIARDILRDGIGAVDRRGVGIPADASRTFECA